MSLDLEMLFFEDWMREVHPNESVKRTKNSYTPNVQSYWEGWRARYKLQLIRRKEEQYHLTISPELSALREDLASKAMQGMLSHNKRYKPREQDSGLLWHDALAKESVDIADAMIRTIKTKDYR